MLGCAAVWSDFLIRDQLAEMGNASVDTRNAVEATNRLAKAAEASAGIARDTEIRQLRAYLDTHTTGPPELIADQPANVGFIVRNAGRTPAYHITIIAATELRPYPPLQPEFYPVPRPSRLREATINPGRSNNGQATSEMALLKEQIDEIIDGSRFPAVYLGYNIFHRRLQH